MAEIQKLFYLQCTCYKKYIARKKPHTYGLLNGATKASSALSPVCILFNNNFDLQIMKTYMDKSGCYVICDLKANGKFITLANVYAPNEDDTASFKSIFDHLLDFKGDKILIGGDFNLVRDVTKDKMGGLAKTHHNA